MTAFEILLKEHAVATEAHLAGMFDAMADGVPERLLEAMRHAVLGGGKRFRPFLVCQSAALFGVEPQNTMATAGAIECLHCYSLAHDDLPAMDDDKLRRGRPTVWAAFDEWTAILAGDALLTFSFEILADPATHDDAATRSQLVAALAVAAGPAGMVGGQTLDLCSEKLATPAEPTLDYIRRLQALKTGALIRFACESGAILGQASSADRQSLRDFGNHLGIVFQIADDLLDATGDAETVGKATGKDTAAGKATQVSLLGVEAARRYLNDMVGRAISDLERFGTRADHLREAVHFAAQRSL